ncbi:MAG: GntR family transcriptional regulator [Bacteroidales bacterium]|nr:GntR family transcriptional regulator [Bacteroidales bacterium]
MKTIDYIFIDNNLQIPKYKQLVSSIQKAIESELLQKGDKVDSINTICKAFSLSRDTVMVAFNELKTRGILTSIPGKGYYIKSTNINFQEKVFLLFDELNAFKEDLYNSFMRNLSNKIKVDIYFHHFNRKVFNSLITENTGNYSRYVIMPASFQNFYPLFSKLPKNRIYILDQTKTEFKNKYPGVYQNFEKDIYNALISGNDLLRKYKKLILVFPAGKEPKGQLKGFVRYCNDYNWEYEIIQNPFNRDIKKEEVYIAPNDRHLVYLVKEINKNNLNLGKDVGLISYNDTPLKEIAANGITTISTDFEKMGESLAKLIENKQTKLIENPSSLIIRNSL